MESTTGFILTAIVAAIGMIKFKLIEELVKKMTSSDQKAKVYSILFLFVVVVILFGISMAMEPSQGQSKSDQEVSSTETKEKPQQAAAKSELKVKVSAVKDGIALTEELVQQAKENKRKKDSTYIASRHERWVYSIGDWTDDDVKILEMHKQLVDAGNENIKLIKQGKKYLFIKEDLQPKDTLEASLEKLRQSLSGLPVGTIDINTLLTRKKYQFRTRTETFGRRKNKIKLDYLEAD